MNADVPPLSFYVMEEALRRAAFVEDDVARAMELQDHGHLDRLVVVIEDPIGTSRPYVASRIA